MLAHGMTYEKREALSNYQTILTLSEIILTGEMQRYASRAKSYLQDNGLYKQQAKKEHQHHHGCAIETAAGLLRV